MQYVKKQRFCRAQSGVGVFSIAFGYAVHTQQDTVAEYWRLSKPKINSGFIYANYPGLVWDTFFLYIGDVTQM